MELRGKEREKVIEKIRRCLALTSSNWEGEASTAMRAAKNLMNKYQLTLVDLQVDLDTGELKKPIQEVVVTQKEAARWEIYLLGVVTGLCGVEAITSRAAGGMKKTLLFVGLEEDAYLAKEVYLILKDTVQRLAKERGLTTDDENLRNSYMLGVVYVLAIRVDEMNRKDAVQKVRKQKPVEDPFDFDIPPSSGEIRTTKALMVVKHNALMEYLKRKNVKPPREFPKMNIQRNVFTEGVLDGGTIDLNFRKAVVHK